MSEYKYTPTTWIGGKTIGTADVMNNIEDGIVKAHERLNNIGDIPSGGGNGDVDLSNCATKEELKALENTLNEHLENHPSVGASEKEFELIKEITVEEDVAYIFERFDKQYAELFIFYENLYSNKNSNIGVALALNGNLSGSIDGTVTEGAFIQNSSYKSIGSIYLKKMPKGFIANFNGRNSGGNSGAGSGVPSSQYYTPHMLKDKEFIDQVCFSLSAYAINQIGAGAVIRFYGR